MENQAPNHLTSSEYLFPEQKKGTKKKKKTQKQQQNKPILSLTQPFNAQ